MAFHEEPESTGGPSRRRVLVVDDDDAIRFLLEEYFDERGYEVTAVAHRDKAEQLLDRQCFEGLVVDLALSHREAGEGVDLVRFARQRSAALRIVVLSGTLDPTLEVSCLERGADAYLHKPLPLSDLELALAIRG